jgi:hypothetical protein
MRKSLAIIVSLLSLASGCKQHPSPASQDTSYVGALTVGFFVVNKAFTQVGFEFRVDGVQLVDTVVSPGGVPALVLERQIRLTPGRHRLELYDRRLQEFHVVVFDVQPRDMSIELTLGRDRSSIRAVYARLWYL